MLLGYFVITSVATKERSTLWGGCCSGISLVFEPIFFCDFWPSDARCRSKLLWGAEMLCVRTWFFFSAGDLGFAKNIPDVGFRLVTLGHNLLRTFLFWLLTMHIYCIYCINYE